MCRLTIAILALTAISTTPAVNAQVQQSAGASTPSLSDRMSSLHRRWASEEQQGPRHAVTPAQHTEEEAPATRPRQAYGPINQQPPKRSQGGLLSGDLFSALRGGEQPEADQPPSDVRVADNSRQRAGSAFTGTAPATNDIGAALSRVPSQPTPAPATKEPAASANRGPVRRPYSSGDGGLDLITSSGESSATRAPARADAPRVALSTQAPSSAPTGQGYATAADAARALAGSDLATALGTSPTTGSPSDIPAVVSPLMQNQSQKQERYAAPPASDPYATTYPEPPEATNSSQPVTPIEDVESTTDSKTTEPQESSSSELQPDWDAVGTNPMRSQANGSQPTPAGQTPQGNVLMERPLPMIMTQVMGPSEILIGREATYRVTIQNRGGAAAESLIADISVPEWAEVIHSKPTSGTVSHGGQGGAGTQLQWELPQVASSANEELEISLVPKTSQPLALGVTWRQAPVAATTHVVVQEPKLAIAISGPDEVFFGRPQAYRLTISNPGTGLAEKVVVQLMPPGGGEAASSHRLEGLKPGESKVVEVEITAREAGELAVSAVATSDGGLRADATQPIFCRKPELQIDWRGPGRKFAGTEGTYYFRVRNPGTAAADQVEFDVALPGGFEFVSASDGYRHDEAGRRVTWKVGTLRPGDDCYLEIRGVLNQPGNNSLVLSAATTGGEIHHTGTAATEVVALPDLKLEVSDPKGPVPVGQEVEYDIIVTNRGLSPAEDVRIAGFFSAGVEPLGANGGEAQITDGRVSMRPVESLGAGQQVRVKIRAKAQTAGTHLFRAEVLCRDSEIKLAAEETTRYFSDEPHQTSGDSTQDAAARESRFEQVR